MPLTVCEVGRRPDQVPIPVTSKAVEGGRIWSRLDWTDTIRRQLLRKQVRVGDQVDLLVFGSKRTIEIVDIDDDKTSSKDIKIEIVVIPESVSKHTASPVSHETHLVAQLSALVYQQLLKPELNERLGISPARAVLISGPHGSGRHTLLCSALAELKQTVPVIELNLSETLECYSDYDTFGTNQPHALFADTNERIQLTGGSVIVLVNDIDMLAKNSSLVDSEVATTLAKSFGEWVTSDSLKRTLVVALSDDATKLPAHLRDPTVFARTFTMSIPSQTQRRQIISQSCLQHGHLSSICNEIVDHLAPLTAGFVPGDFVRLFSEQTRSLQRMNLLSALTPGSSNSGSNNSNNNVLDAMRGFRAALELVSPSQLVGFEASIPKRSWTDIGGYSALISRIRQTLALIQSPLSNHQALGISPPRGILLHGASGCGKTLIAHAIANSTGLSVLEARPFELLSMYLGDTEANIRSLFKTARQMAPCIVLMDELDVLATKRETDSTASDGAGGLNERTLSTLLNEMDGVQDRKGVLIVGCTSRLGAVDEAIIRPGRFDLLLHVDYPTRADRRDILRILTADGKYSVNESEVDLDRIADMTDGFTGADLDAILRDAAVSTLRRDLTAQFINNDAILNAINDWYEAN